MSGRSGNSGGGGRSTGAGAEAAPLAAAAGGVLWPPHTVCGNVARWAAAGVWGMVSGPRCPHAASRVTAAPAVAQALALTRIDRVGDADDMAWNCNDRP